MAADIIARGLGARASQAAASKAPRLSIVSAGVQTYNGGVATIATAGNKNVVRRLHVNLTGKPVRGVRFLYGNYRASGTPALEVAGDNAIIISGSAELSGTATDQSKSRQPVYSGNQPTLTLTPVGGKSSPLGMGEVSAGIVQSGATFYERTAVTVGTNGQVTPVGSSVLGGTTTFGMDNGEGWLGNQTTDFLYDGGGNITVQPVNGVYTSLCALGYCTDGSVATSVAICGDSIGSNGQDDAGFAPSYGGWPTRGLAATPSENLGFAGEQLAGFVANPYARSAASEYATHFLMAYGRNELSGGSAVATFQANLLALAKTVMTRPQTIIAATILPAPTTTDGWYLVANMSPDANDTNRAAINDWLRDTSASGFVAQAKAQVVGIAGAGNARVFDACASIEVNASGVPTTNGGRVFPATTTFDTGTMSAGAAKVVTDSTKAWTVNAFRGRQVYIVSGTGAGQSRCIAYNGATTLNVAQAFSPVPDATSVYRIDDAMGFFGVHPGTRMHTLIGADLQSKLSALLA